MTGTTCTGVNCPQPTGACCAPIGSCSVVARTACVAPSTYRGHDTACSLGPCPILTGACCRGVTCAVVANSAACTGANTRYVASQNLCNAGTNSTTPCCRADFNKTGGITIQDVFGYLTAWFAASPSADYDTNGANPPTIQSLTSYLAAWFAGGCS